MDTTFRSSAQRISQVTPPSLHDLHTTPRPHIPLDDIAQDNDSRAEHDEVLRQNIFQSLNRLGYRQFGLLEVTVDGGRVTLKGQVARYYWRQLAENAVLRTVGVHELQSEVEVTRS